MRDARNVKQHLRELPQLDALHGHRDSLSRTEGGHPGSRPPAVGIRSLERGQNTPEPNRNVPRRIRAAFIGNYLRATAALLICGAAVTEAMSPHLALITPSGGQRGTELEVNFQGERLEDTEEIMSYEPGLEVSRLTLVTNKVVNALINIKPSCTLGEHHLRLRGASGFSELRTFFVDAYPAVPEVEPNNDLGKAQKINLNSTVTGVITDEDVDCFAVAVRKGQLLSAEVEGMRLGRGVFDPRLAVLGPGGAVLSDVDDTQLALQDPFISLVAPEDGTYIIRLRDVTYGGNGDCHYRLHIGSFPRPTVVYPLGGKAGELVRLAFFSEATGPITRQLQLPAGGEEKFGVFAEKDGLSAPSPNWIRVSAFPNVLEAPPKQDRAHATITELHPPLALNGVIGQKGEEDWFRFPGIKGAALEVNVFARRLRSPLDSTVEVFDANGTSLAANDDAAGPDSYLKFTPAETTNYFLRVRDSLGQGGRDFAYRVEITPAEPRLALRIPEVARNDTQSRQFIAVPRRNRFATLISAKRVNLSGELAFALEGLPPGLTMQADRMPWNLEVMPLVFEATPDAPIGGRLLDLEATGTNAAGKVTGKFSQEVELVPGPNNTTYYNTSVDKICVAVTKEAPFKLWVVPPGVPLVQAGSMRLEIAAERAAGFDEPIKLQMVWNPPGVSSQSEVVIPKSATNAFYPLNAAGGAEIRGWGIAVLGHAAFEGGEVYASSQLARLEVAAPFLAGKIETAWSNPGKPARLTVNLEPAKPFDGKARMQLCGLPEKITAPEKEITKDDREVVFDITVDAKCATGTYRNLFCAVDVPERGRTIPHTIAAGGMIRIVPPKKEVVKVAAVENKRQ